MLDSICPRLPVKICSMIVKTKCPANVETTCRAQPVGQRPDGLHIVKIRSHVNSLAEESRAKNDVPVL